MKASDLEWGFKLLFPQDGTEPSGNIEAPALWGARLLVDARSRPTRVEVLWDRQDAKGDTEDAKTALVAALNGVMRNDGAVAALTAFLEREIAHYRLDETSHARFDKTLRGVRFRGSPNASHGYIYVTANLENTPTCDGCGTGGSHKGTAKFPGLCIKCRDEVKADARAASSEKTRIAREDRAARRNLIRSRLGRPY